MKLVDEPAVIDDAWAEPYAEKLLARLPNA